MKHLIVYTHLNPQSFTKAVSDKIESTLKSQGHDIKTIDLYKDNFNPVLHMPDIEYGFMGKEAPEDVKHYQELIGWADNLIFIFPLWWGHMPAMLKGFIDRTLTNGFAFKYDGAEAQGLLGDKTAQLFVNAGSTEANLTASDISKSLHTILNQGLFEFCGVKVSTKIFYGVPVVSQEERTSYLESVPALLA